jgi:hypothetical protein
MDDKVPVHGIVAVFLLLLAPSVLAQGQKTRPGTEANFTGTSDANSSSNGRDRRPAPQVAAQQGVSHLRSRI